MYKVAILGASKGQYALIKKAKELGIYTVGFAWEKNAICKNDFSKFYPISILEKDKIVEICKNENIDAVVSTGSDLAVEIVSYISNKLNLIGNNYENFVKNRNKYYVRQLTNSIPGLTPIETKVINNIDDMFFPCIVKPSKGSSKFGITYIDSKKRAIEAYNYAKEVNDEVIIEKFIEGQEISVASISFNGKHKVIQIADKKNTGAPHFVELEFQAPSKLPNNIIVKIHKIIPEILDAIGFQNGATNIDMKVNGDKIYLIEVNMRGIGGKNTLVFYSLSIDFDYLKAMFEVALGTFKFPEKVISKNSVGLIIICKQNIERIEEIKNTKEIIKYEEFNNDVVVATNTANISGSIIYTDKK